MSNIKLEFPVLIQKKEYKGRMHYFVRPLFLDKPVGVARRFDSALRKLQNEIKPTKRIIGSWLRIFIVRHHTDFGL